MQKRLHELEVENARNQKNQNLARKYAFWITGAMLLAIGAIITLVAYRSYNLSPIANVLMMVCVGSIFVGALTMFLNTGRFMNRKVAEALNLSSVIVVGDLLRDLQVTNKGVYLPSAMTGTSIKVFVPLKRDKEVRVPPKPYLADDRSLLFSFPNPERNGVLLKPLGYHLFLYTIKDLQMDWSEAPEDTEDMDELDEGRENGQSPSLTDKLQEVLVKGLEFADKVVVSQNDGQLRVRLINAAYLGMCASLKEEAPQVCAQIGCPLSSMIACAYTEFTGAPTVIEEIQHDEKDVTVVCRSLARREQRPQESH
jgi:hypothetical protein